MATISSAQPSLMAASTTCPAERRASSRAPAADQQQHGAAAIVGDQIQRRRRPAIRPADGVQRARQRQIIDIVTGGRRQRPGLAPTGHPTVDQAWLRARQTSGPSPSRSMTPGRKPSISASARSIRRSAVATPAGLSDRAGGCAPPVGMFLSGANRLAAGALASRLICTTSAPRSGGPCGKGHRTEPGEFDDLDCLLRVPSPVSR